MMRGKRFDTITVHGVYNMAAALANQGSIIGPGYFATSQHFENSDHMEAALAYQMPSWTYARIVNPTQGYLEETLALLEGYGYPGEVSATVTASGMAAVFMATNPFLMQESGGNGHSPARPNIVADDPGHLHPPAAGRGRAQVPGNLIRLSVGGEHPADIIEDLAQALG